MEDIRSTSNNSENGGDGSSSTQNSVVYPQNQLISIKLIESNYLIWKQQIYTAIKGYGLENFITGESKAPPELITDKETQRQVLNLAHILWHRQDQILASWILSSLSESILVMMVGLNSSYEIWKTLDMNFANQSQARVVQYKLQLQTLKKENLTMREYLNKIKGCCDILASIGYKLSEQDIILQSLLKLQISTHRAPVIWMDNLSAISLASNPILHARTKHIELDFHFVRERMASHSLSVQHVSSIHQIADILTKPLSFQSFTRLRNKLIVTFLASLELRGDVSMYNQQDSHVSLPTKGHQN